MIIINREEYIKNLIKKRGLTAKDFAKEIDMPYTTLLSILNRSIGGASVDNVIKICNGLNIKVDDLNLSKLEEKDLDQFILNEAEINLFLKYRKLDSRGKYNVEETINREYSFIKEDSCGKKAK